MSCLLIFLALLPVQQTHAASKKYVVNLLSMKQDINLSKIKNLASLKRHYNVIVYTKPSSTGKIYVLSVGYFSSFQEAKNVSMELGKIYKGAYPAKFISGYTVISSTKKVSAKKSFSSKPRRSSATLSDKQLDQIINSARSAIKQGENRQAIQLLSAILSVGENRHSREALELLGVARERNGQYNHAVNAYNKYIKKYPDSDDLRRVKQRLAVLLTAEKRVDKKTKKGVSRKARPWQMAGSLSQTYSNNNGEDADLYTFLSVAGRKRNEETDIRLQFTGSRTSPIKGNTDTDFQISEVYADILFREGGFSTKFGRQRSRTGGLFGRLDGLLLSYEGSNSTRYNFLAGIPVASAHDFLFDTENNKKLVYGLNTDLSFFNKVLDLNLYVLEQRNDGILDRQVVGAETRIFKRSVSIFSLFDYDISYDETNIFLLTGNWQFSGQYNFFFNVDYRNNPFLTTANALIGQTETDLGTLVSVLGEEAVRQLAIDRSSTSKLLSLGLLGPLSDNTTIRGDISTTEVSESVASGGVPGLPMIGPDYYYSLQFVTRNYFDRGDTSILQFQYADTEALKKFSSLVTTRIPITHTIRIAPRAILTFNNLTLGKNRTDLRVSMRTDYKYNRRLHMDVDVGMDFSDARSQDGSALTNYYLTASYHWLF
jgi:tetratricopeptide (TPR) repeat protein